MLRRVVLPRPDKLNNVWELLGVKLTRLSEITTLNLESTEVVATKSNWDEFTSSKAITSPVASSSAWTKKSLYKETAKMEEIYSSYIGLRLNILHSYSYSKFKLCVFDFWAVVYP